MKQIGIGVNGGGMLPCPLGKDAAHLCVLPEVYHIHKYSKNA